MSERPYLQLYIADYLGDTQHLSCEQHGAYLLLLMSMWRHGGYLPNDPVKLARVVGLSKGKWLRIADDILALCTIEGDQITQKRLQIQLKKAREISLKRSKAGAGKPLENNEPPSTNDTTKAPVRARVQISDSRIHTPKPPRGLTAESQKRFDEFWTAYPRKTARRAAERAYAQALARASPEEILSGAKRYARERHGQDVRYTAHPATWLNADRWKDEAPAPDADWDLLQAL